MSLPFEKTDPGVRQYCCFVCGRNFKQFEEFKEHIIENHEEGREFVLCPLERCKCPVRDVRAHFRACHKQEKIPTTGQMRVLVWNDVKDPKSKRKRKPTFREGYFVSEKNNGKPMHYRSGYEEEVYKCLENLNEVESYDVEPFPINYWFKGEAKSYFPDLIVHFTDGHTEVWEIKPKNQTTLEVNDAKWTAANNYCMTRNMDFKVLTERGIELLKKGKIV